MELKQFASERSLHRQRVESRRRRIPGWHDPVDWSHVEQMRRIREERTADEGKYLTIDAVHPKDKNVQTILKYVDSST